MPGLADAKESNAITYRKEKLSVILFIAIFVCANLSGQQLLQKLFEVKTLLILDPSKGMVFGNVGYDVDQNGIITSKEKISGQSMAKIESKDILRLLESEVPQSDDKMASSIIKAIFAVTDSGLSIVENEKVKAILGIRGSRLSLSGIHPLKLRGVYFIPDGSGNVAKDPTIITFFKSGQIWELNYGMPGFYMLKLSDGQDVYPRNSRFYEGGLIAAIDCDSRYFKASFEGKTYSLSGASWTSEGNILSMTFQPNEEISFQFPNGEIASNPQMISFSSNFPSQHDTTYRNTTLCYAVFRSGSKTSYRLPNGQVIVGNLRSIRFYDSGELLGIHLHEGEPIHWLLPKGQPVMDSIPYVRKQYWEPSTELNPKATIYEKEKMLDIVGGAGFTKNGELIGYRQDYNGY